MLLTKPKPSRPYDEEFGSATEQTDKGLTIRGVKIPPHPPPLPHEQPLRRSYDDEFGGVVAQGTIVAGDMVEQVSMGTVRKVKTKKPGPKISEAYNSELSEIQTKQILPFYIHISMSVVLEGEGVTEEELRLAFWNDREPLTDEHREYINRAEMEGKAGGYDYPFSTPACPKCHHFWDVAETPYTKYPILITHPYREKFEDIWKVQAGECVMLILIRKTGEYSTRKYIDLTKYM